MMLVSRFGPGICDDERRCSALLRDMCRDEHKREVSGLVAAVRDRAAFELANNTAKEFRNSLLLTRLCQRLRNNQGLQEDLARWAIETWAISLGILAESDATVFSDSAETASKVEDVSPSVMAGEGSESGNNISASSASSKLNRSRDLLLDLSLRNRLLNFPQGNPEYQDQYDRVQKNLPLMADLERLWQKLVIDEKSVDIYSVNGESQLSRIVSGGDVASSADPEHLEKRLQKLFREHQTLQASTGDSAFFATIGFLEWRDDTSKESRSLFAPLLLLHVRIIRKGVAGGRRPFLIEMDADQHSGNPSLQEKLKSQHNLVLPSSENVQSPGAYFREVESAIRSKSGWKVHRTVALGFFNFARYRLWLDLDPKEWPDGFAPSDHPIVLDLIDQKWCGNRLKSSSDDEIAVHQQQYDLPVVLEADSTQYAALLGATKGQSLVIIGPPGSGKSQTIANLIAISMSEGRRILFVAQKKAALEVVQRLLNEVGLSAFCLPLHSDHLKPVDVHRQLSVARTVRDEVGRGQYVSKSSKDLARLLNEITASLRKNPDGGTESISTYIQRACAARAAMKESLGPDWDDALLDISLPAGEVDNTWTADRERCLREWSNLRPLVTNTWIDWQPLKLLAVDLKTVEGVFRSAVIAVDKVTKALEVLPDTLWSASIEHIVKVLKEIGQIPLPQVVIPGLLGSIWRSGPDKQRFYQLERQVAEYHSQKAAACAGIKCSDDDSKATAQSLSADICLLLEHLHPTTTLTAARSLLNELSRFLLTIDAFAEHCSSFPEALPLFATDSKGHITFVVLRNLASIDGQMLSLPSTLLIGLARHASSDLSCIKSCYDFAEQLSTSSTVKTDVEAIFPHLVSIDRNTRKRLATAVAGLLPGEVGRLSLVQLDNLQRRIEEYRKSIKRLIESLASNEELQAILAPGNQVEEIRFLAKHASSWTSDLLQPPAENIKVAAQALATGQISPTEIILAANALDEISLLRGSARKTLGAGGIDIVKGQKIPYVAKLVELGAGKCTGGDIVCFIQDCRRILTSLEQGTAFFQALSKIFGQAVPDSIHDLDRITSLIGTIENMPQTVTGGLVDNVSSLEELVRVRSMMEKCQNAKSVRDSLATSVRLGILPDHEDIKHARITIASNQGDFFRVLKTSYRSARQMVQKLCLTKVRTDALALNVLDQLDLMLATIHEIDSDSKAKKVMGPNFKGLETDWKHSSDWVKWAESFYGSLGAHRISVAQVIAFRSKNGSKLQRPVQIVESLKKQQDLIDASPLSKAFGKHPISLYRSSSFAEFQVPLKKMTSTFEATLREISGLGCGSETPISEMVVAVQSILKADELADWLEGLDGKLPASARIGKSSALRETAQWFIRGTESKVAPSLLAWLADQPQSRVTELKAIIKQCSQFEDVHTEMIPGVLPPIENELLSGIKSRMDSLSNSIVAALPLVPSEAIVDIPLVQFATVLAQLESYDSFRESSIGWNSVLSQDALYVEADHCRETLAWVESVARSGTPLPLLRWCLSTDTGQRVGWWIGILIEAKQNDDELKRLIRTGMIKSFDVDSSTIVTNWHANRLRSHIALTESLDRIAARSVDPVAKLAEISIAVGSLLRTCIIGDDLAVWEPELRVAPRSLSITDVAIHQSLEAQIDRLPEEIQRWLVCEAFPEKVTKARDANSSTSALLTAQQNLKDTMLSFGPINNVGPAQMNKSGLSLAQLREILSELCSRVLELLSWASVLRNEGQLQVFGLSKLADFAKAKDLTSELLVLIFEAGVASGRAKELCKFDPHLANFSGAEVNALRDHFAKEDGKLLERNRLLVARGVAGGSQIRSAGSSSQAAITPAMQAILSREESKQRKHLPVRKLVETTAPLMQSLCPCWLMTPLDVAQSLKPGAVDFDLIIMDEASQLPPEDAWGVIARGKQIVVVGDPKQMPPSDFFSAASTDDEDVDEDEVDGARLDSILDASKNCMPQTDLLWHYRSRHQTLIAPANRFSYRDRLVLFPSAYASHEEMGIRHKYVAGATATTGRVVNSNEASAIVERLIEIALIEQAKPLERRRSVGVIAMNQAQMDCIQELLDAKRRSNSTIDRTIESLEENTAEPLLVMNLENVQGDQRDIILISCTYAPTRSGAALSNRFGPINLEGGERRFNVLITRAKWRMEVFTSIRSDQIAKSGKKPGVHHFHDFLRYAETGQLEQSMTIKSILMCPFQDHLSMVFSRNGYEVERQVGVAGYFVDLAIRDPKDRNRFILGIECDSATYFSAKSARDRDRLRENVKRDRGWRLHRVWSMDWFTNSGAAEEALLKQLSIISADSSLKPHAASEAPILNGNSF